MKPDTSGPTPRVGPTHPTPTGHPKPQARNSWAQPPKLRRVTFSSVATRCFDVIENCHTLIAFNTSANTISVNTYLEFQQMLKMSFTRLHVLSQPLSKTRDKFVLQKIFRCFLQCNFKFRNYIWLQMKLSKKLCTLLPRHDICRGFKFRVRWPLFLLNHLQTVCLQTLLSNMWHVHRAQCISLNLPLHLAAVFNKFWKYKLINSFNYWWQKH